MRLRLHLRLLKAINWSQVCNCQDAAKCLLFLTVETSLEKNLLSALAGLDGTVKSFAAANPKPDLLALFARVEELATQLPRETDPILFHYLQKKSYEKARLFLLGRDAQNQVGNCRHL
jgi:hypothetical protein